MSSAVGVGSCRGAAVASATMRGSRWREDKLMAMIDQHRNHPSIILWSLGNEDDWRWSIRLYSIKTRFVRS